MSTLSVALSTFNGARYLEAQLESIAAQSRSPDELIITDDGSTDSSTAIIRRFASQVNFPILLHVNDRNVGSTRSFEHTISRCSGDIIALCDQDDVWLSSKLATIEKALNQDPDAGLVFSDAELVDENLKPLGHRLWESTFSPADQEDFRQGRWLNVLMRYNVVTGATMAFRAKFRPFLLPIPELKETIHDGWIALIIGVLAKLALISEPLILYRQHSTQQIGVDLTPPRTSPPSSQRWVDYGRVAAYYANEVARLTETVRRLIEVRQRTGPSSQNSSLEHYIARIQDLITHYRVRGQLPPSRLQRVGPVAQEFFARRYHRYSSGTLSALRDLVRDVRAKEYSE